MKIIFDAAGGDNAPLEIVKGAIKARNELDIEVVLIGEENKIKNTLESLDETLNNYEIINTVDNISNEDEPAKAVMTKRESSIVVGLNKLANKEADAFLSAGNTGALLAGGMFFVKRIEGIMRSPIVTSIPVLNSNTLFLDSGANVDCTAEMLLQFAIMGTTYLESVYGINNPKVGLLNIGSEPGKGNSLTKESFELLKNSDHINFFGNIEARDVPFGIVDIVITDGFAGNVFLKAYEGTAMMLKKVMIENIQSEENEDIRNNSKIFLKKSFEQFDYESVGGAPLLGLNMPVFKAHGSSDARAIFNGVKQIVDFINNDAIEKLKKYL
ncbi:MAG: phosphate acyltransferase PlsX [Tissierellia bacterium]|nr:phosphate acyltransferase PlsX [Tissierellia bacterium]